MSINRSSTKYFGGAFFINGIMPTFTLKIMHSSIETAFRIMNVTRDNIMRIIDSYDISQLNKIPEGFNNNLAWNFGHVVVTQQLLTYGLSGLPLAIDAEIVSRYRKGSKPEDKITEKEIQLFKDLCTSLPSITKRDYLEGKFVSYKEYTTSYGMTLHNVNEAIIFNNIHEGLHLGTCLDLKKFV